MNENSLTSLSLRNFTAFEELDVEFSPGVNILIGANATGKTHILKLLYAACAVTAPSTSTRLDRKLLNVFVPFGDPSELVHFSAGAARVELRRPGTALVTEIVKDAPVQLPPGATSVWAEDDWRAVNMSSVYIPPKDMLASAAGFRSLYSRYELEFDETYFDILDAAYVPFERSRPTWISERTLDALKVCVGGEVRVEEEFFVLRKNGERLRFALLAEGLRKIGLLWRLVMNGTLKPGAILFWDEPESNLNPGLMGMVVELLLELQRCGVQIFLATHNYVVMKEFHLRAASTDRLRYHSLYREPADGSVRCSSANRYETVEPNLIVDTYVGLYERDVERNYGDEDASGTAPI